MVFLLMGGAYLRSRIKQAGKWDQETIVSFFLCQYCSGEYLRFLKVSRTSVNKWVSNFLLHGVAGLDSVRPPGRPAKLGAEQLSQLSEYIDQQSRLAIGGRLQGTDIQTYIEREFGVAYELSNVYRLLRELGFSWITSRSRHPKQDGQVQEAFKKLPAGNDP